MMKINLAQFLEELNFEIGDRIEASLAQSYGVEFEFERDSITLLSNPFRSTSRTRYFNKGNQIEQERTYSHLLGTKDLREESHTITINGDETFAQSAFEQILRTISNYQNNQK